MKTYTFPVQRLSRFLLVCLTLGAAPTALAQWALNGTSAYYNDGKVGIGTASPSESLTIAGVPSFSGGLRLTGNSSGGTGMALENTSTGGHKYDLFSGGSEVSVGVGGFAIYDETASAYRLAISPSGNVGMGTPNPAAKLEVRGDWDGQNGALKLEGNEPTLRMSGGPETAGNSWIMQVGSAGPGNLEFLNKSTGFFGLDWGMTMAITPGGRVGIGTADPSESLTIAGVAGFNDGLKVTGSSTNGTGIALENTSGGGHKFDLLSAGTGDSVGAGGFGIYDETTASYRLSITASGNVGIGIPNPHVALDVNGTTRTKILAITGSDVAELFKMPREIPKGAVVIIDDEHPGQLKLSTEPYDRRVGGVVSGANGISPGIAMNQEDANEGSQNVALSGRVYVLADSSYGAIQPGDLLTTSGTPGHAMKVTNHERAQGAILGKAMSRLQDGKGMVLILVTLQ